MTAIADIRKVVGLRGELDGEDAQVIIVTAETGVMFEQQCGGVACNHQRHEGWLLRLPPNDADIFDLSFWETQYNRRMRGDDEEWARCERRMEAAVPGLTVVPHPDNEEAWVHVTYADPVHGVVTGILTWENCD